jgi:hypothetical protein
LVALNGVFYRGIMGSGWLDRPLEFAVIDKAGTRFPNQWVHYRLLEGDGAISADSVKSSSDGRLSVGYSFSGSLGHAVIRAVARNLDSVEVYLRANTLIPGDHGQGQYILLDDTYGDILDFNGLPQSLDTFPALGIAVANYEATLGMVAVLYDTDENGVIEPTSPVYAVFVVDSVYPQPPDSTTNSARYGGTTADGIGIGSHWMNDVRPVLGFPQFIVFDDDDPNLPAIRVIYDDLHLTFWCHQSDSTTFQIDIAEEFDGSLYQAPPAVEVIDDLIRGLRLGRHKPE